MVDYQKQKIKKNIYTMEEGSYIYSRKESFDTLKFFLAFFVIVIHTGFTGYIGLGINAIARIAVPLFFMITGYYLPTMNDEKFKKYIYKIIYLTVISTLFYALISYTEFGNGKFFNWFTQTFKIKKLCCWLFLNTTPIAAHLWYFYALLYVLIIIYTARIFKKINLLYKTIPLLFLGNYIFSYFHVLFYRNFLFTGLLYVLLGYFFRNNEKTLINITHTTKILILGLITFCIGLGIEMFVYKLTGVKVIRDHFLFTLPMVICIFILTLRHPHIGAGAFLTTIGKKYSGYIYIMHPFVMFLTKYEFRFFFEKQVIQSNFFRNIYPFIVFGITLTIVFIGNKLFELLQVKRKNCR